MVQIYYKNIYNNYNYLTSFCTILENALEDIESGKHVNTDFPLFSSDVNLGSIGKVPKKGTHANSASAAPPPELNIFVHSLQLGHSYLKKKIIISQLNCDIN